jgi:hypothetical protein
VALHPDVRTPAFVHPSEQLSSLSREIEHTRIILASARQTVAARRLLATVGFSPVLADLRMPAAGAVARDIAPTRAPHRG